MGRKQSPETDDIPGALVASLTWADVAARLAAGALAVLPIGAASKEHGRHLPLATDYLQAEWLSGRIVERHRALVWPTLPYGHYPAFVDYPGSNSLSRETFIAVVAEILQDLERAGAQRIAILNTGISTIGPLRQVLQDSSSGAPLGLINVYSGPRFTRLCGEIEQQPWGGHADEIETSLMLAIAPERVHMDRARPAKVKISWGCLNRHHPDATNYSPDGVNGDPTLASRDKGERLLQALLADVLDMLDEFNPPPSPAATPAIPGSG